MDLLGLPQEGFPKLDSCTLPLERGIEIKLIDSRLLREAGAARWFVAGAVALAMLGSASTAAIAWSVSVFIDQLFIRHVAVSHLAGYLYCAALAGLAKAILIWLQEILASRAAASVKEELRRKFYGAINRRGPGWLANESISRINLLATSGLDSLDNYFAKYLPQVVHTMLTTPILVALVWASDFQSGLTLILTLPLIPTFMILIGWVTNSVQKSQLDSLARLSQHFLEVLRGLTTLKIFGRLRAQEAILRNVSEEHRKRTMKVLRITFLSGFALELIASLSVALIAVSIGLRLLSGDISLTIGLFVLLVAPDVYLPLRQVGAQYHASSEGMVASKEILDVIGEADATYESSHSRLFGIDDFSAQALTAIVGPSGVGKSTIFRSILGLQGEPYAVHLDKVAWMPQEAKLFQGSVVENIVGPGAEFSEIYLNRALSLAGVDDLDKNQQVGVDGSLISGGQAQRVSLARTFYRGLLLNVDYMFLDEPTSALDEHRAEHVINSLRIFVDEGFSVAAITHSIKLTARADKVLEVSRNV